MLDPEAGVGDGVEVRVQRYFRYTAGAREPRREFSDSTGTHELEHSSPYPSDITAGFSRRGARHLFLHMGVMRRLEGVTKKDSEGDSEEQEPIRDGEVYLNLKG